VSRLDSFKAKARALAQSGSYYGLPPLQFELSFEEGFEEAREWLALASTQRGAGTSLPDVKSETSRCLTNIRSV
jgi:hypothetical protein